MISMLYNSKYSTFFSNTGLVLSNDAVWQIRGRGFFLCVNEYEIKLQYVVGKFFFYICKTPKCDNALWNKSIFTLKTCIEHEIITDVK